jgi:hypothetical protein
MPTITEEDLDRALSLEEARKTLLQAYTSLFKGSPNGELVLKDLRAQFFERSVVVPEDKFGTIINAAKHDVVTYVLAMIEEGERYGRGTTATTREEPTTSSREFDAFN